jgi:23S rRNA (guanosine2251-2'-O)-methyltransferase
MTELMDNVKVRGRMDNPKWTKQMDSSKWTPSHYCNSHDLYKKQRKNVYMSIWDCPFGAVHLSCPFGVVHFSLFPPSFFCTFSPLSAILLTMTSRIRYIMGKNSIRELLRTSPERIIEVYTSNHSEKDELQVELSSHRIPIKEVGKNKLIEMVNSDSHQSYVASIKERPAVDLKYFLKQSAEKKHALVVMLDSIYDPQNMGAILRSAECFGADLVVYSKNRGTDITPVVSKTSSGATELVPICKVSNLAETIKLFQEVGYWVVSAEGGSKSKSIYTFEFPEKTLLILGSEREGVQQLLSKNSDFHVFIPMLGRIDSLNVSQASAVFLSHYRKYFQ